MPNMLRRARQRQHQHLPSLALTKWEDMPIPALTREQIHEYTTWPDVKLTAHPLPKFREFVAALGRTGYN